MSLQIPRTRAEKIQFLKDLQEGRRSIHDLKQPDMSKLSIEQLLLLKETLKEAKEKPSYPATWEELIQQSNPFDIEGLINIYETIYGHTYSHELQVNPITNKSSINGV